MTRSQTLPRAIIGVACVVALLAGLGSGLARLGWHMESFSQGLVLVHGPLMICGFLGTLICLERAVALSSRSPWVYAVPLVAATGAVALLMTRDSLVAELLVTAASLGLLLISIYLYQLQPARYALVMALGALAWVVGNLLWLAGYPLYHVVHPWTAFLILTIVGERIELSRVRRLPTHIENRLLYAIAVYLAGVAISIVALGAGIRVLGLGAMLMAIWLLLYDITRLTIRSKGLARYIAVCLITGYLWLAAGGIIAMWYGALYAGPVYAALLHAFLLGFVFSMIFGHAPIILPAVTGLRMDYTPIFYVPLALLHMTLLFRVVVNLTPYYSAQQWGGLLNVVALLLFMLITFISVLRANMGHAKTKRLTPRHSH